MVILVVKVVVVAMVGVVDAVVGMVMVVVVEVVVVVSVVVEATPKPARLPPLPWRPHHSRPPTALVHCAAPGTCQLARGSLRGDRQMPFRPRRWTATQWPTAR